LSKLKKDKMATPTVTFRISFYLNNSPKDLTWTDITNWATFGITATNIQINTWMVDPDGLTFHKNAGYDTDDFSTPCIDRTTGATSISGVALPLDSDGYAKQGTYNFYCRVYDVSTLKYYSGTKSYAYTYDTPTPVINLSYSCRTSELTSTDATSYTVDSVGYTAMSRTHTITKPAGSGANDPGGVVDVGVAPTRVIGGGTTPATRLWTNTWTTTLSVVLHYEFATWGGATWFEVYDTMTGSDSVDVQCNDYIADLQTYLDTLYTRYITAKNSDVKEAQRLREIIIEILARWEQYENASRVTDGDPATYAGYIQTLIQSAGIVTPAPDTASVEVVPWGASGVVGGSTFAFTLSEAVPTGGNPGDMHFKKNTPFTELILYRNIGGTWTLIGDIFGQTGADGTDYEPLLNHSVTNTNDTVANAETSIKTYDLPAGTLTPDESDLEFETLIRLTKTLSPDVFLRIRVGSMGGTIVASWAIRGVPVAASWYKLRARVVRTSATTAYYEGWAEEWNSANGTSTRVNIIYCDSGTFAATWANPITFYVTTEKNQAFPAAGDIVCKYFRVKQNTKA
jgi:hypothetical protein